MKFSDKFKVVVDEMCRLDPTLNRDLVKWVGHTEGLSKLVEMLKTMRLLEKMKN